MDRFRDAEEHRKVMETFIGRALRHERVGPKLAASGLVVQFSYTEPELVLTVSFRPEAPREPGAFGAYAFGATPPWTPLVSFAQSAEFGHRFWLGRVNVIAALAKREVKAWGSIAQALALLPAIRPMFRIYEDTLRDLGLTHLLPEGGTADARA